MIVAATPGFRENFREWRRTRPFWGGVVALLAAVELYSLTAAPFALVVIQGVAGISSIIIGLLILVLVVITWFSPILRVFSGLAIVLLGLSSILLTNLGGFLIGMILALVGGSMIAAWSPSRGGPAAAPRARTAVPATGSVAATDEFPLFEDFRATDPVHAGQVHEEAFTDTGELPAVLDDAVPDDASVDAPVDAPLGIVDPKDLPKDMPAKDPKPKGPASALAVSLLVAALAGPATPAAAPSSVFCDLFPFLCPTSSDPTPTPAPAPAPATPVAPSTPAAGSGSGTGGGSGSASGTGTASGTTPVDTSNLPAAGSLTSAPCDPAAAPTTEVLTNPTAAAKAASVVKACVNANATTAPVAGNSEGTIPLLAAQLTSIKASKQTLTGLSYQGIVTLNSRSGPIKALQLTAQTVTIEGIQEFVQANGVALNVRAGGKVQLSGTVHLFVVRQKGDAFGLLPLDLSPSSPPPIILPVLIFTDVDSQIAYFDAGSMKIPAAQLSVS